MVLVSDNAKCGPDNAGYAERRMNRIGDLVRLMARGGGGDNQDTGVLVRYF